jgi:hypothetical protein
MLDYFAGGTEGGADRPQGAGDWQRSHLMIRNLKVLLLAALAVTAFTALAASAAQAVPKFTAPGAGALGTTTLNVVKDGTGKTAHQVFDISKSDGTGVVTFTCEELTGSGTIPGESVEEAVITTPAFQTTTAVENKCEVVGQPEVKVTNTGCDLTVTAAGEVKIVSEGTHNCAHSLKGEHEAGKEPITIQAPKLGCTAEVGAQPVVGKVKFHNLTNALVTVKSNEGETITIETPPITEPLGLTYNSFGVGCPYGTTTNGKYTTGNVIVQGVKSTGGQQVIRWDE